MEGVFGIAALAAIVWTAVLLRFGGLTAGLLSAVFSAIVLGFQVFKQPVGPVEVTIDRALCGMMAVQYAMWRLWHLHARPPKAVDSLLLALVGWLTFSTFYFAPTSGSGIGKLLCYYLIPLAVYFVARQAIDNERSATAIAIFFVMLGMYLAITAICEHYQLWTYVFPSYLGSYAKYPEFYGRARGPLLNPAGNGILLITSAAATLSLSNAVRLPVRMLLASATLLMFLAAYFTLTRSVWIGAALSCALTAWFVLPRRWSIAGMLMAGAVGLPLVIGDWDGLLSLKRDRGLDAAASADSVKLRPILAYIAWLMFQEHPIVGCGFGGYDESAVDVLHDQTTDLPLQKGAVYSQHNVLLGLLTETGLVGVGLFVAVLVLWAAAARRLMTRDTLGPRQRRLGYIFLIMLVNYLANGMFQDVAIIQAIHVVLFFMAGVTQGLATGEAAVPTALTERRPLPTPLPALST